MALPLPTNLTDVSTAHLAHHNDVHAVVNNAAGKPLSTENIRYVSPNGNDANDGLSWGSAKLTIKGAYDSLPSGGTIEFMAGVWPQADHTKGLWFWGNKAGYPRPAGWIDPAKALHLKGVGSVDPGAAAGGPTAQMYGPPIPMKFMFCIQDMVFENISINDSQIPLRIGVNDDGDRFQNGEDQVVYKHFRNCHFRCAQVAGNGPVVDIGANCFWIWFEHCTFGANEQEIVASDKRCGILSDATAGGLPMGIGVVRDCNFHGGGGYRHKSGAGVGMRLFLENLTMEASTSGTDPFSHQPLFEVIKTGTANPDGYIWLSNFEVSDAGVSNPAVRLAPETQPGSVVCHGTGFDRGVEGPALLLSGFPESGSMAANRQTGFFRDRVQGVHDAARRTFAPVTARFTNLAPQDVTTWSSKTGSATVTTGIAGLDGTTNAARLSSASLDERQIYRAARTLVVGDWLIAGVWARAASTAGVSDPLGLALVGTGFSLGSQHGVPSASDEWSWITNKAAIATIGGGSNEVIMALRSDTNKPMDYYAPLLIHLPNSMAEDEVAELYRHLQSWPDGAPVGHVSTLRGQKLITHGGLGVGNSATVTGSIGTPTRKMEVFDAAGASLGYVPIYPSIS